MFEETRERRADDVRIHAAVLPEKFRRICFGRGAGPDCKSPLIDRRRRAGLRAGIKTSFASTKEPM
jgi:hypothetical protein